MTSSEAKRTLELLARGIAPGSGEVLATDSVLNSPAVIRALFMGAAALGGATPKEKAAASGGPAKAGKPWTPEEEQTLAQEFDAGQGIEQLATAHGRSQGGIAARLVKLGKIDERSEVYVRATRRAEGA